MAIRNMKVYGMNHKIAIAPNGHKYVAHNDSVSIRDLMPEKTKKQINREKNIRKFVPHNPGNSKVKKIQGAALVEKFISEGNKEEANYALGRFIYEEQIKPKLGIVAAGIEKDLITFTAEDIW